MEQDERRRRHAAYMLEWYRANRDEVCEARRVHNLSPEKREAQNKRQRERYASLPPEEKAKRVEEQRQYHKEYRQREKARLKALRQTPEGLKRHRETQRALRAKYAQLSPIERRARDLSKYGIDITVFQTFWDSQDGKCSICERALMLTSRGCHVDHDHKSGQVRGLLCHGCNTSLGHLKDSVDNLLRAVAYLQR